MNTRVKSVPGFPGATGPSGRKALFALLGGGAVLAAALGAGAYAQSNGSDSPATRDVSSPATLASEPPAAAAPARARTQHVYLVASEEQAALVWAGVKEANDILVSLGEPLLLDSVVVVPSGVQATAVMEAVAEGNRILATVGGPVSVVVDLRGHVGSDSSLSPASPGTQFANRATNYPASREGLRGHVGSD